MKYPAVMKEHISEFQRALLRSEFEGLIVLFIETSSESNNWKSFGIIFLLNDLSIHKLFLGYTNCPFDQKIKIFLYINVPIFAPNYYTVFRVEYKS